MLLFFNAPETLRGRIVRTAPLDWTSETGAAWALPPAAIVSPLAATCVVVALAVGGLVALAVQRSRLTGTTLVAVWYWSVVCLVTIAGAELLIALAAGQPAASWVMPLRLLAATSSFCPTMALLGAKRPQDRGWQFIVVALWGVLSLPGFHWLLFGGVREMHPAQLGFFAILVGVGLVNGTGTRYWPASVLYAAGQALLLAPFVWIVAPWIDPTVGSCAGLASMIGGWWLMAIRWPPARSAHMGLDRVWFDFRDAFGAVWSLRVMERMNASAAMYAWPVRLTWNGFVPYASEQDEADGGPPVLQVPSAVEPSLRTLLRRFVSAEWIDERMNRDPSARQRAVAIET